MNHLSTFSRFCICALLALPLSSCYPQVDNPEKHAFAAKLKAKLRKEDPVKWAKFDIVPLEKMCSADCDGTVDGGHPNDYGAYRMAEAFAAAVKNSIGQAD